MDIVDGALFAFGWPVHLAGLPGVSGEHPARLAMLLLIVFWVLLTYLLLPRLHRILTRLYVPGYFIGRARTATGCSATS